MQKPTKGEKAKVKLKIKNIIPIQENTSFLLKKTSPIVSNYFKISIFIVDKCINH